MEPNNTGVEFEQYRTAQSFSHKVPFMVGLIMKYSGGRIKDEAQANYALLGIAAIVFIISLYFWFK